MHSKKCKLTPSKVKFYLALNKLGDKNLIEVLNHLNDQAIDVLCECIYNSIYTDLNISKSKKKRIKKFFTNKKALHNLKLITNKTTPIIKKRKALNQEGKGIGAILGIVAPLISSLISSFTK